MYRISLPLLSECQFVTSCMAALQAVLKPELSLQMLIKWYGVRNAPGSHDLSASQEWAMFRSVLLDLIGRPMISHGSTDSHNSSSSTTSDEPKKRRKSENCLGTEEDWLFMERHLNGVATGLTLSEDKSGEVTAEVTLPRNNSNAPLFAQIPLVFYTLHMFYEDQKLSSTMPLHMASLAEVSEELFSGFFLYFIQLCVG